MAARKVEDGQKTFFPRIVRGPLGCHLLSSLVPKSRFRGFGKIIFFKQSFKVKKKMQSISHPSVRPKSLAGADLLQYSINCFGNYL